MLAEVREEVPDAFLLVPGVGAQGGTVAAVAEYGLTNQCGLLVNSSRGILYAAGLDASQEVCLEASANAAQELAQDMKRALMAKGLL